MKTKVLIGFVLLLTFFCSNATMAQRWRNRGMHLGKMDQLERVRLLDALELDETTSVKLISRFKEFRLKQRDLNFDIDSLAEELQLQLDEKKDQNQIKKLSEAYVKAEISFNKNRIDFIYSLSDILTPEQIGRLLVFERNFKKEIQKLMLDGRGRNKEKQEEN